MKKFFITAIVLFAAVLAVPAVSAFADNTALKDIPMLDDYFKDGGNSKKAYCYLDYKDGFYTYTYCNSKTEKILYKSKNKFRHDASISKDGKIVFYGIDDSVYRYSYTDNKTKKIYTDKNGNDNFYIKASSNGEYCGIIYNEKFILWHDGKAVSAKLDEYNSICEVTDDGKIIFYSYEGKIFSFSFETKKTEKIADASDDRYFYLCDVFYDSGNYVMYGYNNELQDDDNDDPEYDYYKVIYTGKLNEQPKLAYSGSINPKTIVSCCGNGLMICDGEYFIRTDLDSGVSKKIVNLDTERLGKRAANNVRYSDDLDSIVYIDYSINKLVRLSNWSKNAYTKRQTIDLIDTETNYLGCCSDDLSVVEIFNKTDGKYTGSAAFFESGKLIPTDRDIIRIDRFNHVICGGQDGDVLEILNSDGSTTKVFGESYQYYFDGESGYFIFGTKEATEFDSDGRNVGGIYHDYYIGKNGKAVHLWDGRNTYEINFAEDWDLDD